MNKEFLKYLIKHRTLIFSDNIDEIAEIDERLRKHGLKIVVIEGADSDTYVIAPLSVPDDFVKTIVDVLLERNKEFLWTILVSRYLEKCDTTRWHGGPAYVYVVLASAFGIELNGDIYVRTGYTNVCGATTKSFYYDFKSR